jgi:hypothetical protein
MASCRLYSYYFHEKQGDVQQVQASFNPRQTESALDSVVKNVNPGVDNDSLRDKVNKITGEGTTLHTQVSKEDQTGKTPEETAVASLLLLGRVDTAMEEIQTAADTLLLMVAPSPQPEKKRYMNLEGTDEGIKARDAFIASEIETLMYNFRFEKKGDPNHPQNCNVKLPNVHGPGYQKVRLNRVFFDYAINEYEKHHNMRVLKGEKRSRY